MGGKNRTMLFSKYAFFFLLEMPFLHQTLKKKKLFVTKLNTIIDLISLYNFIDYMDKPKKVAFSNFIKPN